MTEFDPLHDEGKVPSPCINVCSMNPRTGLCEGCLRTIEEIAQWSTASEERKREVWMEIRKRRDELF
ncbi:DUF1289 domain-containing protein [Noviherbaspirillum massiliense]|uniref:DUF1289 domain-containing protein n=1 Tax=Noviherbaspirillum massiliense TaxID=1465823 RepID=UPI00030C0A4C|nr:DUF1289 domain-containing protein [Noviherbaspirillum massiliense]